MFELLVVLLLLLLCLWAVGWVFRGVVNGATLIGCRSCRKQIHRRATICPYCRTERRGATR